MGPRSGMMGRMRSPSLPSLVALFGLGCAGAEFAEPAPVGRPTRVEILDASHVTFEGGTIPVEAFVFEMRQRVRAAAGNPKEIPAVTIIAPAYSGGVTAPQTVQRLLNQLRSAGVRHIALGEG